MKIIGFGRIKKTTIANLTETNHQHQLKTNRNDFLRKCKFFHV